MPNYLKPGMYVTEIDLSNIIAEDLDFPELVEVMASEISSRIKTKHRYDIWNATINYRAHNDNIGGVGVHLHDGFASVFHRLVAREVEYTDPDALDNGRNGGRRSQISVVKAISWPKISDSYRRTNWRSYTYKIAGRVYEMKIWGSKTLGSSKRVPPERS